MTKNNDKPDLNELIVDFKRLADNYFHIMEGDEGDPEAMYEMLAKYSLYDPRAGGPEDYTNAPLYDFTEDDEDDEDDEVSFEDIYGWSSGEDDLLDTEDDDF